jgi:hypothetical protein
VLSRSGIKCSVSLIISSSWVGKLLPKTGARRAEVVSVLRDSVFQNRLRSYKCMGTSHGIVEVDMERLRRKVIDKKLVELGVWED